MHHDNEKSPFRFAVPAVLLRLSGFAVYIAVLPPGIPQQRHYLGGLIFLQILLVAIWNYQDRFFPLLVAVFLWAGTSIPLNGVWTSGTMVGAGGRSDRRFRTVHAKCSTSLRNFPSGRVLLRNCGTGFRHGVLIAGDVVAESIKLVAAFSLWIDGRAAGASGPGTEIFPAITFQD